MCFSYIVYTMFGVPIHENTNDAARACGFDSFGEYSCKADMPKLTKSAPLGWGSNKDVVEGFFNSQFFRCNGQPLACPTSSKAVCTATGWSCFNMDTLKQSTSRNLKVTPKMPAVVDNKEYASNVVQFSKNTRALDSLHEKVHSI